MEEPCYSHSYKLLYPRKNSRENGDDHSLGAIKKMLKSVAGVKDSLSPKEVVTEGRIL